MDFLSFFALGIILFTFLTLAYGIIAIHDIPYNIAKARNHPHQDAIHAAGWVSLFTLHAIWPSCGYGQRSTARNAVTDFPAMYRPGSLRMLNRKLKRRRKPRRRPDMDLLLILTYAAICYGIFKLFKIPVNAYTLLTAVLGGVFLLGFLLLAMNYNHPFTKEARFFYYTTPIVPTVSGRVVEVVAKPGEHLKAGDVLFRIEDTTYRNAVAQKRAELADMEQAALQLKAALESAQKRVGVAMAERPGRGR
jgi:hypothetical protein